MGNHADNFVSNINYISGLIDSDGSVYAVKRLVKGNKLRIGPKITFTNTNFGLIEIVSSFLHNNDINHYVGTRDRKTVYKVEKSVEISRISKCMELANILKDTVIGRKKQLLLIEEFCRDRSVYVEDMGWKFSTTPYTNKQINLADLLIESNYNYNIDTGNRNYTYSWLGGFLDGDGSIFISSHKQGFPRTDIRMEPTISFSGESTTIFNNIKEMFNRDNITYTVSILKCKTKRKDSNKSKFYYNLAVKNQKSLRILVNKLSDRIFAKSRQLTILDRYLNLREFGKKAYCKECFDLCEEITLFNH